jgi:alginate O-acetyltransferase complex protein AlgI
LIFTTPEFVLFFLLFFGVYGALGGRGRKWTLLLGSYAFYGSWDARFLLLILGSTALDFYLGRRLHAATEPRLRKRLLAASLTGNLGALAFFKYWDFFATSAADGLQRVGLEVSAPVLDIILPVGISFYTFQTLSYTIDIYRRQLEPTERLLDFALYVAFFPQLVAGPIERARHLLPQIVELGTRARRADLSGLALIALGAFKKVVIADNLAPLVEATYADPSLTHGPALWLGTYAFAVQIYCDFSGYSDIAIGLGRLLGLDIMTNFRSPYAAAGPSELWRRWHISLSTWLRDYLYIPLGGNRGGEWHLRRNLLITMLLGGLWHGASWNFVLWGAYHGALLVLFRPSWLRSLGARLHANRWARWPATVVRRLVFFHLVCLGWALFRAESLADCAVLMERMLDFGALDLSHWLDQVALSGEGP